MCLASSWIRRFERVEVCRAVRWPVLVLLMRLREREEREKERNFRQELAGDFGHRSYLTCPASASYARLSCFEYLQDIFKVYTPSKVDPPID